MTQLPDVDDMLATLRIEPEPVDELTRARWLSKLGPQLDAIDARRRRHGSHRWIAAAGVAIAAAAAAFVWWPHRGATPPVAFDRARLHPYVVSGASVELTATTLLAGRFASLDVPSGELVRAELDGDRLAVVGPARLDVAVASDRGTELISSGTLLVDGRAARPLVVHAGGLVVRAQRAVFAASARTEVVYVERGTVELAGRTLHAGEWFGPQDARLVAALREHEHAIAPASDGAGIVAVASGSAVTTGAGDVLGSAPVWARVDAGQLVVQVGVERHEIVVKGSELVRLAPAEPPPPAAPASPPAAPASPPRSVPATQPPRVPSPARVTMAEAADAPSSPVHEPDIVELYARADAALAHADAAAAEAALTELLARFPDAPQAAQALYDLAQLANRRGDLATARADLARLLAGSPPAALAEPARYLTCRLDVERGQPDAATACFTAFRTSFPHSTHDAEVLAWLAGRAREIGGCAAAHAASSEYVRRYPTGPFAPRAKECAP